MSFVELVILAVGLSMDAFAVSICKGLSTSKLKLKHAVLVGLYFGGFQALMPAIGYFAGSYFAEEIAFIDHWIAFIILGVIGGNMIKEAFSESEELDDSFAVKTMLLLAISTSIDALTAGITLSFLNVNIFSSVALIGVITCVLSMLGIKVGNVFGDKYKSKAEFAGGLILILIGTKVLLEHLGILSF